MELEDKLVAVVTAHPRGLELVNTLYPHLRSTKPQRRAIKRSEVRQLVGRLRQEGLVATERRGDRLIVIPR